MKLFLTLFFVLSAGARAEIQTASTSSTLMGSIEGVSIRPDLKEATVLVSCAGKKALIKFTKNEFGLGAGLSSSIGHHFRTSMFHSKNNLSLIDEYEVTQTQELLPGDTICK